MRFAGQNGGRPSPRDMVLSPIGPLGPLTSPKGPVGPRGPVGRAFVPGSSSGFLNWLGAKAALAGHDIIGFPGSVGSATLSFGAPILNLLSGKPEQAIADRRQFFDLYKGLLSSTLNTARHPLQDPFQTALLAAPLAGKLGKLGMLSKARATDSLMPLDTFLQRADDLGATKPLPKALPKPTDESIQGAAEALWNLWNNQGRPIDYTNHSPMGKNSLQRVTIHGESGYGSSMATNLNRKRFQEALNNARYNSSIEHPPPELQSPEFQMNQDYDSDVYGNNATNMSPAHLTAAEYSHTPGTGLTWSLHGGPSIYDKILYNFEDAIGAYNDQTKAAASSLKKRLQRRMPWATHENWKTQAFLDNTGLSYGDSETPLFQAKNFKQFEKFRHGKYEPNAEADKQRIQAILDSLLNNPFNFN